MPHKIVLDTDPGTDDVMALLLLLASPEVHIEAITVTFGNTDVDAAYKNVLKTYEVVRRHCEIHPEDAHRFRHLSFEQPTILSKGAAVPIEGTALLAEYFHGEDGLSNISETHPEFSVPEPFTNPWLKESSTEAADLILEILRREPPKSVTILAVGPLTNVAHALAKDPSTMAQVKRIVFLGGAFESPGNTTAVGEFNVVADPYAAHNVFSGYPTLPVLIVPLDTACRYAIPFSALILQEPISPLAKFVSAILERPRVVLAALGYSGEVFEMLDPLAAFAVVAQAATQTEEFPAGFDISTRDFVVERIGEHTRGMIVMDRRPSIEDAGVIRSRDGIVDKMPESEVRRGTLRAQVLLEAGATEEFVRHVLQRIVWWSPQAVST